jgi:cell division protein FtsB
VPCTKPAVWGYLWDWGEQGVCCAEHGTALKQLEPSLERKVTLSPLQKAAPAPLTRDERTLLIAGKLSAEAELDEAKVRGLDLYRENVKLTAQVQSHTVRGREREAQLQQAQRDVAQLREDLAVKDAEHAELVDEVTRLRTLAKFVDAPDELPPATVGSGRSPSAGVWPPPPNPNVPPEGETTRVDG